jgi:hypothetical protein
MIFHPSILSQFDKPTQLLIIILLFGLFAYIWYAAFLSHARLGRPNIHYVNRATVRRLDAQARGDDPEPLEESAPVGNARSREAME